jgi:hypothetical protein
VVGEQLLYALSESQSHIRFISTDIELLSWNNSLGGADKWHMADRIARSEQFGTHPGPTPNKNANRQGQLKSMF